MEYVIADVVFGRSVNSKEINDEYEIYFTQVAAIELSLIHI